MTKHFFLSEKDEEFLREFDLQILLIKQKKIDYLRKVARRKGIIAENLKNLKSNCGEFFKEIERKDSTGGYRRATAGPLETAYLCCGAHTKDDPNSCGWVKGYPRSERYDNRGPLSGSVGTRFYCQICGKLIEEHRIIIS